MAREGRNLPDPVSPDLYTRQYFTTDCEGYDIFAAGLEKIPERIREALDAAGDLSGKRVLDIGCGRGELACEAARRGAHAVGIDYAEAALELSRERRALLDEDARRRVEFMLSDAKGLAFPDGSFDVVFFVDVYEHLHPHEIESTLAEIGRVLRPGGSLIVHTGPNTWFYRFGYPLVRAAARLLLRREFPQSLRGQYDDVMHVNEQSPLSLLRGLRKAGYRASIRPRSFFPGIQPAPWEKLVMKALFARPLGYFFCTSLMAVASPRPRGSEAEVRAEYMARLLNPPRGARVLLVGEEEGLLARRLARLAGVEVTWLEPGPRGGAHTAAEALPGDGYRRLTGDLLSLPFADGSFDAVASQFTLDRADDPAALLREWRRVLAAGGALALAVRNRLYRGMETRPVPPPRLAFSPRELRVLAEKGGFHVEGTPTLFPDLKLPALYRGDHSFFLYLAGWPFLAKRGRVLFLRARRTGDAGGTAG